MNAQQMKQRLAEFFPAATHVEVHDLTGTENHWDVLVRAIDFEGLSRIERHQRVMAAFAAELKTGEVHALSIRTQTTGV